MKNNQFYFLNSFSILDRDPYLNWVISFGAFIIDLIHVN